MNYIEVVSKLGKRIRITKNYWDFIITKHESVKYMEKEVAETLINPEIVRLSKEDPNIFDDGGFIITVYLVDKIKKGELIYETNKNNI